MKIGTTRDVQARLKGLQEGSPVKLVVVHAEPGDLKRERELHTRFAHLREHGEWFRPSTDMPGVAASGKSPVPPDRQRLIDIAISKLGTSEY